MFTPNNPNYHRELRAKKFTDQIIHMMQDFLPLNDKICRNRVYDYIYEIAYNENAQIINVPLEYDHINKLELERRMMEMITTPIQMESK